MRSQQVPASVVALVTILGLVLTAALLPSASGSIATAQSATGTPTATVHDPIGAGPERVFLPLVLQGFDRLDFTPPPPGLTATGTSTPTERPTATAEATEAPPPSDTPVFTATVVPTDAPTSTVTPKPMDPKGHVVIVDVIPVTIGASFEAVVLQNQGDGAEDLTGWHTVGAGRESRRCDLPAGLILEPQAYYEVRSGKDAAAGPRDNARFGPVAGHVCTTDLIWNNNEDRAILFDANLLPRSKWCWNQSGPFTCP